MSALQSGIGFHADIKDLHLHVMLLEDGWGYRVIQRKGNSEVKGWTQPPPTTTGVYGAEPENSKVHATSTALNFLKRSQEDPRKVSRSLTWTPIKPGA